MTQTQRCLLLAVLAAGGQFVLTTLVLLLGAHFASPQMMGKVKLVAFATTIVYPIVLAQALGLWKRVGFKVDRIRPSRVFIASLLTGVIFLFAGVSVPPNEGVMTILAIQLANAFGEELLFRGVIFAMLLPLPRWQGIVASGVLFGSMHLIQGFMGAAWDHALWQAAVTSVAGMMFTAVRFATGSLWLTIFLHMFLNLCMIFSRIEDVAGEDVLFMVQRFANLYELLIVGYVIYASRRVSGVGRKQTS